MSAIKPNAIRKVVGALCFSALTAQANPLMILGGINGVVDAVKRTAAPLAAVGAQSKPVNKARICLPGAHLIERDMSRDAVQALVGMPAQTDKSSGEVLRDIYKVKRDGGCALDQVEITYAPNEGAVDLIQQKCGDITSNENRTARYSFRHELPPAFDRVTADMARDSVMEVLGAPVDTREASSSEFVDVYAFGAEQARLTYTKGSRRLQSVVWNGAKATLPRMQRSSFFEATPAR